MANSQSRKESGCEVKEETPTIKQTQTKQEDDVTFKIKPGDTKADKQVCDHWVEMWKACCGTKQLPLLPNHEQKTLDFIAHARDSLEYQTFVAETDDGTAVGSVSCQVWAGPQPSALEQRATKIGTMWAVYVHPEFRRQGIASALVERCIEYWRSIGCTQAVLLYASEDGMRVYRRLGFAPGSMLVNDLPDDAEREARQEEKKEAMSFEVFEEDQHADLLLADNYRKVLLASGFQPECLRQDMIADTLCFIKSARERLDFRAFVACNSSGEPLASICCQVWEGPFPFVLEERSLKFGSLWGLYVRPDLRKTELVPALIQRCVIHLETIGCKKIITLCPNEETRQLLETYSQFRTSNAMVLDLEEKERDHKVSTSVHLPRRVTEEIVKELRMKLADSDSISDKQLGWLLGSNHNQLRMLDVDDEVKSSVQNIQKKYKIWVDPNKNWFTNNVKKLGKGFDLAELSKNPDLLAAKFNKLAPKYEEWTLGNRSKVEDWIVKVTKTCLDQLPDRRGSIFDICCGTGLMGQMLRLGGFDGFLAGYDISQEMLNVAESRQCYDYLKTANANDKFPLSNGTADAVLCTGAMELLQVDNALAEFARLLKKGGHLWVSFQQDPSEKDASSASPTAHQNVHGITEESMKTKLLRTGFEILDIEKCADAFHTPSPSLDGTLLPVPYFFVCCRKV